MCTLWLCAWLCVAVCVPLVPVPHGALCVVCLCTALDRACRVGFTTARVWLHRRCVDIVRSYRVSTTSGFGATGQQQEMLPENLQLLPLYTMALEKSPLLRGGNDLTSDVRSALMFRVRNMSNAASTRFIHPSLYFLHNLNADDCMPVADGAKDKDGAAVATVGISTRIKAPNTMGLSAATLTADGMALLDDGVEMFLWVGRAVDPSLLNSLFGVPSLDTVDCSKVRRHLWLCGCGCVAVAVCVMWSSRLVCLCPQLVVQPRDNDFSRRVCALLSALRESCSQQPKLHVVRAGQNNAAEVRFLWRLVEDPASYPGGKISYKDFYGQIHRESQQAAPAPGTGVHTGAAGFAGARRG